MLVQLEAIFELPPTFSLPYFWGLSRGRTDRRTKKVAAKSSSPNSFLLKESFADRFVVCQLDWQSLDEAQQFVFQWRLW